MQCFYPAHNFTESSDKCSASLLEKRRTRIISAQPFLSGDFIPKMMPAYRVRGYELLDCLDPVFFQVETVVTPIHLHGPGLGNQESQPKQYANEDIQHLTPALRFGVFPEQTIVSERSEISNIVCIRESFEPCLRSLIQDEVSMTLFQNY